MKTLKNHTILYDSACPMCSLYTGAFVRTGMLDENGRAPYQDLSTPLPQLDCKRAVDEIALVNHETGEVYYGTDSLFRIIGHALPLFRPLFRSVTFTFIIKKLYRFISYNRRVIIPAAPAAASSAMGEPSFRLRYRLLYLVFTWLITATILNQYSRLMTGLVPPSHFYREFLVCGAQILWQSAIVGFTDRKRRWDYLGNMMTVSFAGGLALLPALVIGRYVPHAPFIFTGYFLLVAGLMLLEHIRRMRLLKLSGLLSVSWIIYRLIIILIIFI